MWIRTLTNQFRVLWTPVKQKTVETKCLINKLNLFFSPSPRLIKTNCNCILLLFIWPPPTCGAQTLTCGERDPAKNSVALDKMLFTQHHIYLYNWELTYFLIVRRRCNDFRVFLAIHSGQRPTNLSNRTWNWARDSMCIVRRKKPTFLFMSGWAGWAEANCIQNVAHAHFNGNGQNGWGVLAKISIKIHLLVFVPDDALRRLSVFIHSNPNMFSKFSAFFLCVFFYVLALLSHSIIRDIFTFALWYRAVAACALFNANANRRD